MRVMFTLTLLVIAAGLVFVYAIGWSHL